LELLRRIRERFERGVYAQGGSEVWEGITVLYFYGDKQQAELITIFGESIKVQDISSIRIEEGVNLNTLKEHTVSAAFTNLFFKPPVKAKRGEFNPSLLIIGRE